MTPTSRKPGALVALLLSLLLAAVLVAATVLAAGHGAAAFVPHYTTAGEMMGEGNMNSYEVSDLVTGRMYSVAFTQLRVIDTQPGLKETIVDLPFSVGLLALSPDGQRLYLPETPPDGEDGGRIAVMDTTSLAVVDTFTFTCPDEVWWACRPVSLAEGPAGRLYVVLDGAKTIDIHDSDTGDVLLHFDPPGERVGMMAIHGATLYTLNEAGSESETVVRRFDISDVTPVLADEATVPYTRLGEVTVAPDGSFLMTLDSSRPNGKVVQIDTATLAVRRAYLAQGESVHYGDAVISSDSQEVVLLWGYPPDGRGPVINAYDAGSGALVRIGDPEPGLDTFFKHAILPLPGNNLGQMLYDRVRVLWANNYATTAPVVMANFCGGPFVDNFSNPASGWPIADHGDVAYGYDREQYFIQHRDDSQWSAVSRGDVWHKWNGAGIRTWIPSGQGAVGLVFGLNDNWTEFYTVEYYIVPQGAVWGVFHYLDGWHLLANGLGSTGLNQSIQLVLEEYGDGTLAIRIGDSTVFTLSVAPAGRIGLSGASLDEPAELRYDDYFIFTGDNCVPSGGRASTLDHSPVLSRPPLEEFLK